MDRSLNKALKAIVNMTADAIAQDKAHKNIPIGKYYRHDLAIHESKILKNNEIIHDRLLNYEASVRSMLTNRKYFRASISSKLHNWAIYWAIERAVIDHRVAIGAQQLHEETQTAALFGTMATQLSVFSALEPKLSRYNNKSLYYADCKSDRTESVLGADFAVIIPCKDKDFKVALFQAKVVDANGEANIYRKSPKKSHFQQITRLLRIEKKFNRNFDFSAENMFFNKMCFYVFWHRPNSDNFLRPTIISALQAFDQLSKNRGSRISNQSGSKKAFNISPIHNGTLFSESISLLLAEKGERFGAKLNLQQLRALLSNNETRPKKIIGINTSNMTGGLGYWRNIVGDGIDVVDKMM